MADSQDKWETFKGILNNDLETWVQTIGELDSRKKLTIDLQERSEIEGIQNMLNVYIEILTHYLGIMEVAEQFDNGGTETTDA